jgi:hypothetical protein
MLPGRIPALRRRNVGIQAMLSPPASEELIKALAIFYRHIVFAFLE